MKVLELVPAALVYAEGNTGNTLGERNKSFEAIDLDDNAAADIGDDCSFRVIYIPNCGRGCTQYLVRSTVNNFRFVASHLLPIRGRFDDDAIALISANFSHATRRAFLARSLPVTMILWESV